MHVSLESLGSLSRLRSLPPAPRRLAGLLLLLLAGVVDYATGQQVAAAPFYIPILLFLALVEPWPICLAFSLAGAGIYLGVELLGDPAAIQLIYPYWRALARLMGFGLISTAVSLLVVERQRLADSERALREQSDQLAEKNRALNETLQRVQQLHLELLAAEKRASVIETVNAASYEMERPLVSIAVYAEQVAGLLRRLPETEQSVLILDELRALLAKLTERIRDMERVLGEIRNLRREGGGS